MHDSGAGAACAQRDDGSRRGSHPSWRLPPDLRGAHSSGDFSRIAARTGPSRRFLAGGRARQASDPRARRDRRRCRCCRLQHLLLDALADVGLAGRHRNAGSCAGVVATCGRWSWCDGRRVRCLSGRRLILTPVARRCHMPFAAIVFASVVSMLPGVFLFRMASGLLQLTNSATTTLELLGATIADGMTAINIILAMSFGLIVPKILIDRLGDNATRLKS